MYDNIKKKNTVFLPWELTVEGLPSIFKVIGIRPTEHLAVELGVYDWTVGRLVDWVRVVANPIAGEQCTGALVGLDHGSSVLVVVMVVFHAH